MRLTYKDYQIDLRQHAKSQKYFALVYLPAGEKLTQTNTSWTPSGAIVQAEAIISEADRTIRPWYASCY